VVLNSITTSDLIQIPGEDVNEVKISGNRKEPQFTLSTSVPTSSSVSGLQAIAITAVIDE